jgi:sugar (pentulose or hexulose) kinase
MKYVAVIDIGKSNAKLAIVDCESRQETCVIKTPNDVIDGPPYPHYDTEALWRFIIDGLSQFAAEYTIDAITVTTHGASVALLDKSGQLATPVLDYEHDGPSELADEYRQIRPLFNVTGSPHLALGLNVGAQLHWLFQQDVQLHQRTNTILMYPQYWTHRLCGALCNEITSLGAHTDLWIPSERRYSELVDHLDIADKMADVKLPTERTGSVLPSIAQQTGLAENTAVYCGIHDSNASLYTHLHQLQGAFSVVSTGTWVICMSPGSDINALDETRDTLLNVNARGEPTPSSRFMGGREYEYLVDTYGATVTDEISSNVLDLEACILPSVEASCGPFQHCKYRWTLNPEQLSAAERYNVISFYLAMMTDVSLKLSPTQGPVIIEGPFSRNHLFCTMLAAASGREIIGNQVASSTGTSIGAAVVVSNALSSTHANSYIGLANTEANVQMQAYAEAWRTMTRQHHRNRVTSIK